ncbi:hypothetical protein IWQ56_006385, partial [Coemansia nantahalensis]
MSATGNSEAPAAAAAGGVPAPALDGFELASYLGEYRGLSKVQRALYVAEHCPELGVESLRLALAELQAATYDTTRYQAISKQLARLTGGAADEDGSGWVAIANSAASEQSRDIAARLERAQKQNSKRESFRAQTEHAALLQKMGRMDEAVRALQDARPFCIDIGEQAQLHVDVARVAQVMLRWLHVSSSIQRAEAVVPELPEAVAAELAAMQAQASFCDGKWAAAA